jgi:hypothetical protein
MKVLKRKQRIPMKFFSRGRDTSSLASCDVIKHEQDWRVIAHTIVLLECNGISSVRTDDPIVLRNRYGKTSLVIN